MKITLETAKLIGFRVLNIKCVKKTDKHKSVLLQGSKIGKSCMAYNPSDQIK
jgi:hypothetical protein